MLAVQRQGQGELVVLLHSSGMSSRQWRRLADQLAATGEYEVWAPDFLGGGSNPPWPDGKEFHFRQDLQAVAELIQDRPVHLVGHSYGGLIALLLALDRPQQVLSLCLYDPVNFGLLVTPEDPFQVTELQARMSDPAKGGGEEWLQGFIDYWNGPGAWASLPAPTQQAFRQVGPKVFAEVRSLLADRTPLQAYAQLSMPTLLMQGGHSPAAAQAVTRQLSRTIPRAQLVRFDSAGHMGPVTHTDEVNREIQAALRGCRKAAS